MDNFSYDELMEKISKASDENERKNEDRSFELREQNDNILVKAARENRDLNEKELAQIQKLLEEKKEIDNKLEAFNKKAFEARKKIEEDKDRNTKKMEAEKASAIELLIARKKAKLDDIVFQESLIKVQKDSILKLENEKTKKEEGWHKSRPKDIKPEENESQIDFIERVKKLFEESNGQIESIKAEYSGKLEDAKKELLEKQEVLNILRKEYEALEKLSVKLEEVKIGPNAFDLIADIREQSVNPLEKEEPEVKEPEVKKSEVKEPAVKKSENIESIIINYKEFKSSTKCQWRLLADVQGIKQLELSEKAKILEEFKINDVDDDTLNRLNSAEMLGLLKSPKQLESYITMYKYPGCNFNSGEKIPKITHNFKGSLKKKSKEEQLEILNLYKEAKQAAQRFKGCKNADGAKIDVKVKASIMDRAKLLSLDISQKIGGLLAKRLDKAKKVNILDYTIKDTNSGQNKFKVKPVKINEAKAQADATVKQIDIINEKDNEKISR